jgi:hypothetical protein
MIFLTQKKGDDGLDYEGEKIEAENFDEAGQQAAMLGVEVLGILDTEHYQEPV